MIQFRAYSIAFLSNDEQQRKKRVTRKREPINMAEIIETTTGREPLFSIHVGVTAIHASNENRRCVSYIAFGILFFFFPLRLTLKKKGLL